MKMQRWSGLGAVVVLLGVACGGTAEHSATDADSGSNQGGSGGSGGTTVTSGGNTGGTSQHEVTTGSVTTGSLTTGNVAVAAVTNGGITSGVTGGPTQVSCPAIEPAVGTACPVDGQNCHYENCVAPLYRANRDVYCSGGAWVLNFEQSCTLGGCPDPLPVLGEWCEPAVTAGPCSAIDPCGRVREAVCEGNGWRLPEDAGTSLDGGAGASGDSGSPDVPERIAPVCPAAAPAVGSDCCPDNHPAVCDYAAGIAPAPQTAGGASGSATSGFPLPTLDCAVCGFQMQWEACP